ncbi:MAG: DUF2569 family protein [Rhizobiaceae bacterium]
MTGFSFWHWLIVLAIIAVFAVVVRHAKRQASAAGPTGPIGVGGWLVIPIIGFIGTAALTLFSIGTALTEVDGMKAIFLGASEEAKLLRLPVFLSLSFGTFVVISASICIYKVTVSRVSIRNIAVIHYLLLATAGFVDLWCESYMLGILTDIPKDPEIAKQAGRGLIAALVWIPYFIVSKRVANTFESGEVRLQEQTS